MHKDGLTSDVIERMDVTRFDIFKGSPRYLSMPVRDLPYKIKGRKEPLPETTRMLSNKLTSVLVRAGA